MFYVTIQKAVFREAFCVNAVHRKNENYGAKHVAVNGVNSNKLIHGLTQWETFYSAFLYFI